MIVRRDGGVARSTDYRIDHTAPLRDGSYDIISKKVKAKDLATDGNSIHEWGYDPEQRRNIPTSLGSTSDMSEGIRQGIREKLYKGRDSFFDGDKFNASSFREAMNSLEDRLTDAEWEYAFNSKDWSALARAHISESDRAKLLKSFSGRKVFHGSPDAGIDNVGFKSKGKSKFVSTDIDSARNYTGDNGRVYEERLNVKNPLFINSSELTLDIDSAPHILDQVRAEGYDSIIPVEGGDIVLLQ